MAKKSQPPVTRDVQIIPYDPFMRYMEEVKKYPVLTREQEHELALLYWKHKDRQAASILITSNLLLVVKLVMEFRTRQQNLLDLIQEGNIGLMEALKRFDPYRDVRFSTYASWWIKAYILKYILDNWRLVKIGTTNKRRKLLAQALGAKESEIIEMTQTLEHSDLSLEATSTDEEGPALIDVIPDDVASAEEQTARGQFQTIVTEKIEKFKRGISDRERVILEERLLREKPATLQEIASKFDKTREAIRYTEKNLVRKLKSFLRREIPDLDRDIFPPKG